MLTTARIVELVKATPQLKIDAGVSSPAFDSTTHPYVKLLGVPEGEAIGGFLEGERAHEGTLTGGADVVAVPLESGGSGGIFTQILFMRSGDRAFAYTGHIDSGGHLDVRIEGGVIVAILPYYGANDPNCCPAQRIVQTYTVRDGRLVKLSEKRSAIEKRE